MTTRTKTSPILAGLMVLGAAVPPASAVAAQAETAPSVGDVVPAFSAEAVDGSRRDIAYPKGATTVLVFFLSSCPTCHRMLPEWNRAWERRPKGLNVVGVMLDREPPGFFGVNPVAFPVVRSPGRAFLDTYKVHRVPVTLRVGPGGKVQDVGLGALDPLRIGELFRP
jgi:redoxin